MVEGRSKLESKEQSVFVFMKLLYIDLYFNIFVFVFEAIFVFVLVGKWLGAIVTAQTGHWPICLIFIFVFVFENICICI